MSLMTAESLPHESKWPCWECGAWVDTEAGNGDSGIFCNECGRWFCDNCYDCELGDGCCCHMEPK